MQKSASAAMQNSNIVYAHGTEINYFCFTQKIEKKKYTKVSLLKIVVERSVLRKLKS